MVYLVLIILFLGIVIQYHIRKSETNKINKTKENLNGVLFSYKEIWYIGGHPLVDVREVKGGVLHICFDKIVYLNNINALLNPLKPIFEIPMESIVVSAVETKESLTVSRILLTGILAFALKKNESYVRIEFNNELGSVSNVILSPNNNVLASQIVAAINKGKVDCLKNTQETVVVQ
ncbi:hypothetical protein [Cohnella soli]|uniref:Uncharacterized protein n=1 Tax=Cohnella soli TaxID=425005 RepID=A0ABW0HLU2_9BACL